VPTDPLPPWVLQQRQQVGVRVRDLRLARDLSQERLGQLAGLDRKTIYRIELAQYGTSIDHLALVAYALEVPMASLFSSTRIVPCDTDL
jgi:transcriptional regulator with XRE-family HTH domain